MSKLSPTAILNIILGSVGGTALVVIAYAADPTNNLPKGAAVIAGIIAGACTAIKSALTQAKGDSDETQGIAPAQVAAAQIAHDAAKILPPAPGVATPAKSAVLPALLLAVGLSCAVWGCKSTTVATATNADATLITSVNAAMQAWAGYVNAGKATPQQVVTVSNIYVGYYNAQLVASNALVYATSNPTSTNAQTAATTAIAVISASASNIVAAINAFSK